MKRTIETKYTYLTIIVTIIAIILTSILNVP